MFFKSLNISFAGTVQGAVISFIFDGFKSSQVPPLCLGVTFLPCCHFVPILSFLIARIGSLNDFTFPVGIPKVG